MATIYQTAKLKEVAGNMFALWVLDDAHAFALLQRAYPPVSYDTWLQLMASHMLVMSN